MNYKAHYVLLPREFKKILRFSGYTIVLFLTTALQLSAVPKASAQKITLSESNVSIKVIFHEIYKQTGQQFVYTDKTLEGAKPVNVNVINTDLEDVLNICFKGQPFTYVILDNAIVIQSNPPNQSQSKIAPNKLPIKDIHGRVSDTLGSPLGGVSVVLKYSKRGTITTASGEFYLNDVPDNGILVFNYIGYATMEVPVNGRSEISVKLVSIEDSLNSVVVNVGYGQQKKEFLTASVSTISGFELVKAPVANLSTALKGQLAGLVALQSSGKPGSDGSTLTIRGIGTYTGQTAPLIMVDGIARDTYDDIDPNEVASISILKDASATAVYGVRGANGVVLITTKRGKEGPPSINFTAQTAISSFTNLPPSANSYDYATVMNEYAMEEYWVKHAKDPDVNTWDDFVAKRDANWRNDGAITYTDDDLKYYQNANKPKLANGQTNPWYDPYFHPNTNWEDKLFKKYAPMSQGNLNISGGTKFMKYFISLGYLNQGGLFKTDYMPYPDNMEFSKNRYNMRGNFDFDITSNFKISVNLGMQYVTIDGLDNDDYLWQKDILWAFPMSSPGMIDGKFVVPVAAAQNDQYNPMYAVLNRNNWNVTNNSILNSSVNAQYKLDRITKGLYIHILGSYDSYFASRSYGKFTPLWYTIRPNPDGNPLDPIFSQNNESTPPTINADFNLAKWRKLYYEGSINYDRTFGKHSVSAMVMGSREKKYDPTLEYDLPHAYEGLTGRVNYNYGGKYIVEYDMGYNGSENFPDGKRFGYFPSYSGSWVASNESFFPKNDIVSFVKLRASYGEVGNDNIRPAGSNQDARYLYLPDTWKMDGGYTFGDLNNQHYVNGSDESIIGNPDVTWEVSKEMNLAIELHLFKSKVSVTYEYYRNNRSNILSYKGTIPDIVQANLPPYNLGRVRSWGHNLEFTYNDNFGDFNFYVRGNGSIQKNKILFEDEAIASGLEYQAATGHPVDQQLLLEADGLYTSWSQLYAIDANGNPILSQPVLALKNGKPYKNAAGNSVYVKDLGYAGDPLQPGDVRLKDLNGDGVVNEKDRTRTGNTIDPVYNYGVTIGFSYKGFDVSALFAGIAGVARGGMSEFHIDKQQGIWGVDLTRFSIDRYNAGDKIAFPIAAYDKNAAGEGPTDAGNTYFLINSSYLRLQNLVVGYTINKSFMRKVGIKSARLYLSGDNLYTWSPAKIWGDPETLGNTGYPLYKTYNMGININF